MYSVCVLGLYPMVTLRQRAIAWRRLPASQVGNAHSTRPVSQQQQPLQPLSGYMAWVVTLQRLPLEIFVSPGRAASKSGGGQRAPAFNHETVLLPGIAPKPRRARELVESWRTVARQHEIA